ncbi:MAG: transglutaminase domain-containing protein [Phycisphaerae bacterium]|nr:transglutaminase domain-containing protein [Phycisphaerae bacterium]
MLEKLNSLPRRYRWSIKGAVLGVTCFLVLYPYPHLFLKHIRHWQNPNALIDPHAPALQVLADELRETLEGTEDPREVLRAVENCVTEHIEYQFDWERWGVADYLPTLNEVLANRREDCDGRAVAAASLLQNLGYRAELVSDFAHVWVKTDHGELLGPGAVKALIATDEGLKVNWCWGLISSFADALGYGVAVFPLGRELIVLVVVWLMLLDTRTPWRFAAIGAVLLLIGLLLMHLGGENPRAPIRWLQVVGFAQLVVGPVVLVWSARTKP